jgi:hypothetical protein
MPLAPAKLTARLQRFCGRAAYDIFIPVSRGTSDLPTLRESLRWRCERQSHFGWRLSPQVRRDSVYVKQGSVQFFIYVKEELIIRCMQLRVLGKISAKSNIFCFVTMEILVCLVAKLASVSYFQRN